MNLPTDFRFNLFLLLLNETWKNKIKKKRERRKIIIIEKINNFNNNNNNKILK